MVVLNLILTILLSYFGVRVQQLFPDTSQWVVVYAVVFLVSWFQGKRNGILATIISLCFAFYYLVEPQETFTASKPWNIMELFVLVGLGSWIAISMDLYKSSRKKLSEIEKLEKSQVFLNTLLENLPSIVFVKDAKDLKFLKINKTCEQVFGFKNDDVVGKTDFDFYPIEQANKFVSGDRAVLASGQSLDLGIEENLTKQSGSRLLHTRKIPIVDEKGKPLYLLGVADDVTDKIVAENLRIKSLANEASKSELLKIQKRESFVANAISTMSTTLDFQATLDRLMKFLAPSQVDWCTLILALEDGKYERAICYHANPELNSLLQDFMSKTAPDTNDVDIRAALSEGKSRFIPSVDQDYLNRMKSGDSKRLSVYKILGFQSIIIVPVIFRHRILGVLTLVRGPDREIFTELDLSLLEEIARRAGTVLENALLFKSTQKAVSARDEFLSIASHELKTPITALRMQLEMLQRSKDSQLKENTKLQQSLTNAVKQSDRLTILVNDLLDISKYETGKMNYDFKKADINELITEVVQQLEGHFKEKNCEVRMDLLATKSVQVDPYRIEQVLVNLLNNSTKFGACHPILIKTQDTAQGVEVLIRDHGQGISPEYIDKIFDKFERAGQDSGISGLGLGLFISKQIILSHRGTIEARSGIESGAEFVVTLPARA